MYTKCPQTGQFRTCKTYSDGIVMFTFSVSRKESRLKIIRRKLSGENAIFV